MKFLYATAAVVVIACGATYLINDAAQKRTAKERLCEGAPGMLGIKLSKGTLSSEYRSAIKKCADRI